MPTSFGSQLAFQKKAPSVNQMVSNGLMLKKTVEKVYPNKKRVGLV
jgi:hypothetical protein